MLLYIGIALCIIGAILVIYAVVKSTDGVDNNGASQLPAWAIGLSLKQYQKLLLEVQHYFTNRQLPLPSTMGL